jgi:hypothetical protein
VKYPLILATLFFALFGHSQPSPQEAYPARIQAINEILKTDSLNYGLIWERLEMKVNMMAKFPMSHELCAFELDSSKIGEKLPFYAEFNVDFIKIHENAIKAKNDEIVEKGDFYLNRMWFYAGVHELDKAIADAKYLRDSASYSRYSDRGDYYNNWALYSLFDMYIMKKDFEGALESIDAMLDKKKRQDPVVYYSVHGGFLSYQNKVEMLVCFGQQDELISYLKYTCRDHFDWYLARAKYKGKKLDSWSFADNEYYTSKESFEYYLRSAKHKSFDLLMQLVDYMTLYDHPELKKYEKMLSNIRFQMNENYETVNPELSDRKLKNLVSGIVSDHNEKD